MKKRLIIYTLLFFSLNIAAQTDSIQVLFNQANKDYAANKFKNAILLYQDICNKDYHSPELYYNMGNAYFKDGQLANAILFYEKALKLKPKDEDIKYNLDYANLFVKGDFNTVPDFVLDKYYHKTLHVASSNTWAIISISLFSLALIVFLVFLFSKATIYRKISFFASIILLIVSIITFSFSSNMKSFHTNPSTAIVMGVDTLKSSPQADGTELVIINEGVKVKIENQNDNWYEVKIPNGVNGWLRKENVKKI